MNQEIKPDILLQEFKQMMVNLERRGEFLNKNFEGLFNAFLVALKITDKIIIEVLNREVTKYGTGAHIVIPQKHLGKNAVIIISNNK